MPPLKSNVRLGLTVIVGKPKPKQNIYWKHLGKQTLKRKRKTLTQVTETKKGWPLCRHEKNTDNWLKKRNPLLNEQKPQNYKLLLKIKRWVFCFFLSFCCCFVVVVWLLLFFVLCGVFLGFFLGFFLGGESCQLWTNAKVKYITRTMVATFSNRFSNVRTSCWSAC